MPRSRQPSIAFAIVSARPTSIKKSAGPPMPNDVRDASGSFSRTPGRARSQSVFLDPLRQLIAKPLDVTGAHQQHEIVGPDDLRQRFLRALERAAVEGLRHLVGEV